MQRHHSLSTCEFGRQLYIILSKEKEGEERKEIKTIIIFQNFSWNFIDTTCFDIFHFKHAYLTSSIEKVCQPMSALGIKTESSLFLSKAVWHERSGCPIPRHYKTFHNLDSSCPELESYW